MPKEESIPAIFLERASKYGQRAALRHKSQGKYADVTWQEAKEFVERAAYGLLSLGIEKGDRVAILSENRIEWAYADLAILSCGAINVPIYATDTKKEVEYILSNSDSKAAFLSSGLQLEKVLSAKNNLPSLRKVITFEGPPANEGTLVMKFSELLSSGENLKTAAPGLFMERINGIQECGLASIIYTSGTTGQPKGVMLTHGNFISNCRACSQVVSINDSDTYLSFLPLSHVFERTAGYYAPIYCGATIAYAQTIDTVPEDIKEVKPTIVCAVPRFYEKVYAKIFDSAIRSNFIKKNIFFWSIEAGKRYAQKKIAKNTIGLSLRLLYLFATILVFNKLKKALGGKLRFFISGGAPLAKEIAEFFYAAGILILEGYGLTETSPVISVNRLDDFKFGTVGQPIPGVEVKIADDGEILTRGPHVMKGYYKNEDETCRTIKDGWLYTGDIGILDEENFLTITDRKKELIVTAGGKNVAPQNIENLLKADRYIAQAMVYGDKKKYIVAIIVPNFDNLKRYADYKKIPFKDITELVKDQRINDFVFRRISRRMADLASYEQIKKFVLLDRQFTQQAGELTPTLKLKRKYISEEYKDAIESMYEKDINSQVR